MHTGWFAANVLRHIAPASLGRMFLEVWSFADASFGFGGIVVGIGTLSQALGPRCRRDLCLLAAFSNLLWFVDIFDKGVPRLMVVGTGLATLLFILGIYMYLFRWPAPASK